MNLVRMFSGRAAQTASLFVVGVAAGLATAMPDRLMPMSARAAVIAGSLAAAAWIGALYWRSLDEVAREAQKSGWYWGGTTGLLAAAVLIGLFPDQVAGLAGAELSRPELMLLTMQLVLGLQLAGFLIGWAYWWWRRR